MAGLNWILFFICIAGSHLSEASPVVRNALVVQAGQNISLTCNLTSSREITWYVLHTDQLLHLLSVTWNKLDGAIVVTTDSRRFKSKADEEDSLEIIEVEEEDAGLYFCSKRCDGTVCFNRGIHLAVNGVDEESTRDTWRQPCYSLGICILPALLLLCFLCMVGYCLCSGKFEVCCCYAMRSDARLKVTEDVSLHYSSLKHADRPRPSGPSGTGLVNDSVIYSTVASRKNPNVSDEHSKR